MTSVVARYITGHEVVLENCRTVNTIRVKLAALHDVFAPDITVLSMDDATVLVGNHEPPSHVQIVINEPTQLDAQRWSSALRIHAIARDTAGVKRAFTAIEENVPEETRDIIYTNALWYYFRVVFGPCGVIPMIRLVERNDPEHDDLSEAPDERGNIDLDFVQTLIDYGADIDFDNRVDVREHGYPPLAYAAKNGHMEACKALLAAEARVGTMQWKVTPFMLAAAGGHLDVCRLLALAGSEVFGTYSMPSLDYLAYTSGNAEMCKLLLSLIACDYIHNFSPTLRQRILDDRFANRATVVDLSAIILVADCSVDLNDPDEKALLEVQVRELLCYRSSGTINVIHVAAEHGHVEMCRVCISAGADVNYGDGFGRGPLDYASTDEVREVLISAGAVPGGL